MFVPRGVLLVSLMSLLWGAPLSIESLHGRIQEAIQTTIGDSVDRVEINFRPLPHSANWPDEDAALKILVPQRPYGLVVVPVEWTDGDRHVQIPVQVVVKVYDQVLVSGLAIDRLSVMTDKDLKRDVREVTSQMATGKVLLRQSSELSGKRTRGFIRKSDILTLDLFEPKPDVLKGQTVTLIVAKGAIEVSLPVTVQQEGKIGETISVKSDKTKTEIKAIVESATLVRSGR
jgi:flagella basal body P-ring formation protein FlgA